MRRELLEALGLKDVTRAGWLRVGVEQPESVAAHSWGVAYLVLALCPPNLDRGRALAIAVLHDVGEVRTGDITPHDGVPAKDKHAAEHAAVVGLTAPFAHAADMVALWREYEHGTSAEGRFVKACDKLDMALQAERYRSPNVDTRQFVESALAAIEDETLRDLVGQSPT